ncbi:hypothetical protein AYO20_08900 [Fonsecaea nubica]|uniref:Uncharacterized protein n=1 Tax=Fonsecaea nubica TaxID=856822 RepID=A0A178CKS3_9EURO|nr:hypothetical protein AYO20_08900 [Fonsecaea nubica]OAL30097.1 hypothetical protein AYO20_08900 [Fonsecaea nubica]
MAAALTSRTFAVTGSASGIGAATARLLARRGAAAIYIGDVNTAGFDQMKPELAAINPGTKVHTRTVDVSVPEQVDAWFSEIKQGGTGLHGLANVAGLAGRQVSNKPGSKLLEETVEQWRKAMGVNIDGAFYCSRAAVKLMQSMPKDSNPAIVNVASMAAIFHSGSNFGYGTAKAGLVHFTTSAAKDLYDLGIRVNWCSSGTTNTPILDRAFEGQNRDETIKMLQSQGLKAMEPSSIARVILWLLSEDSLDVSGVNIPVGQGIP